jgi:hypothetical protein
MALCKIVVLALQATGYQGSNWFLDLLVWWHSYITLALTDQKPKSKSPFHQHRTCVSTAFT